MSNAVTDEINGGTETKLADNPGSKGVHGLSTDAQVVGDLFLRYSCTQ